MVISSRRSRAEYLSTTESSIRELINGNLSQKKMLVDRNSKELSKVHWYSLKYSTKRHKF